MDLYSTARQCKDIVRPFGETDVLLYYATVSQRLGSFLREKEIATKTWLPKGPMPFLLRRGSKSEPLFANEISRAIDETLLALRPKHLDEVRKQISKLQEKVWLYLPPRKLSDFLYATNGEGVGNRIDRVFFDLDRGKSISAEQARQAAEVFAELLSDYKTFACWTGNSFHVFILFDKPQPPRVYDEKFAFSKNNPLASLTGQWAKKVQAAVDFKVAGGHEKIENVLSIDPSQTPSGKLCRAPFSLHMADADTVNGVDVPLELRMLKDKKLVSKLESYTPNKVIEELDDLAKRLPA